MHSTPRLPEVVDFPGCNITANHWYMSMPIGSPLVDPKVETKPELCEEEDATLEPNFLMADKWLCNSDG